MRVAALLCTLALLGAGPARAAEEDPVERALAFLVKGLRSAETRAGMANAEGKLVCARALTLFVLETFPGDERYAEAKRDLERRAAHFAENGATMSLDTWLVGFTSLWLAEKRIRGEADAALFDEVIYRIEEGQNREGGWAHGLNLPISFYPSTLVASTNWCLLALGLFRRLGYEVDDDVVQGGLALLRDVQGEAGAFPYGGLAYRKGFEAGRTTGTVAALAALEQGGSETFRKAAQYVLAIPEAVPNGHASPAMHVLTGALAFRILGDDAWKLYDSAVLAKVRSGQAKDGGFGSVVGGSPDDLAIMGGDAINRLYVTACHAAALAMPRSKVAALLHRPTKAASRRRPGSHPTLAPIWTCPAKNITSLAVAGTKVLAADRDGRLRAFAAARGEPLWLTPAPDLGEDAGRATWMEVSGEFALVWHGPSAVRKEVPLSLRSGSGQFDRVVECRRCGRPG